MQSAPLAEPWLRGILPALHPVTAHLIRASEQIREDCAHALASLSQEQLWLRPGGIASAGFHAKHLAGSTRRLCTYLEGGQLSSVALCEIAEEGSGTETPAELQHTIEEAIGRYTALVRSLAPEQFAAIRLVGRKRIPVTAISLAIHIAEHGQRHTGQLITTAKLAQPLPG